MSLPYTFTATPEDPVFCGHCDTMKDHGDFIDTLIRPADIVSMRVAVLICESCAQDLVTAFLAHHQATHPELLPPEARNANPGTSR